MCIKCESSDFKPVTALVLGNPRDDVFTWEVFECQECKQFRVVKKVRKDVTNDT